MIITPFFDPLLAKIIVTGSTRHEAISRFILALETVGIYGPPNNVRYLKEIADSSNFREGLANTRFLESLEVIPRSVFDITFLRPDTQTKVLAPLRYYLRG
jgi:acetyl/propionyl-CoA carboxylase alpha subunit